MWTVGWTQLLALAVPALLFSFFMTGGIDLFAMKGVSSSSRLTEDMGSSFLKCVGSLDLPPFCQTGKRGKKVLQTILASLYTPPPFLSGNAHIYGNNAFQKGASLIPGSWYHSFHRFVKPLCDKTYSQYASSIPWTETHLLIYFLVEEVRAFSHGLISDFVGYDFYSQ